MGQCAFSIAEFCQYYDIAQSTFFREVGLGRLNPYKCGFRTFVTKKEARRWNNRRRRIHAMQCCRRVKRTIHRKGCSLCSLISQFFRRGK